MLKISLKIRYLIYLALLCTPLFPIYLGAQESIYPPEIYQEIDEIVESSMKDWNVPGVCIGIVKNGELVYSKGYGYRDVENMLPVTTSTLFPIGSITKSFTAAELMLLQEDSLISIDQPVINYFDDFRMYDDYVTENITTRDILTHRSGLPRHDLVWYGTTFTRKQLFRKLRYLQPSEPFRTKFQYQNLMYMTAGYLTEKISGKTWEEFTTEKLLVPLEMTSTNFSIAELQKSEDFSQPYLWLKDSLMKIPFRDVNAIGPAGSINSNVTDLSHWVIMNMSEGEYNGKKIMSGKSIKEMMTPQMVMPSGMSSDVFYTSYGLGWYLTSYRGHLRVEHGGNIDGFSANVAMYPFEKIGIIVLTNMNGTSLTGVIRNSIFDLIMDLPDLNWNATLLEGWKKSYTEEIEMVKDTAALQTVMSKQPLLSLTGKYVNTAYGEITVNFKEGKLKAFIHGLEYDLTYKDSNTFSGNNEIFGKDEFKFITNAEGVVTKVEVPLEPMVDDIVFRKKKEKKKYVTAGLSRYKGIYSGSSEVIKIDLKDETLMMSLPDKKQFKLVEVYTNEFNCTEREGYKVMFDTDQKGNITGIVFMQPGSVVTAKKESLKP